MKRIAAIIMVMVLGVVGITGCGKSQPKSDPAGSGKNAGSNTANGGSATGNSATGGSVAGENGRMLAGKHTVKIKVKKYGTITVKLDADKAPITVTNFVKLVKDGFYNGLTFHRIISSFMIQGGDPLGNGTGGSDQTIKGEFSDNGIENTIKHVRGVISMARSNDPDSASSQFFIMHQDAPYLDGKYAAFGKVTKGIAVVDKICAQTKTEDDNGTVNAENQPVIESIQVVE